MWANAKPDGRPAEYAPDLDRWAQIFFGVVH